MNRFGVALVAVSLAACGGSQSGGGSAGVGASPNAPDWVARGSRVQSGSIFGVGSASGINNPSLARTTAGNRARAEISKILETYSASLMKDYSESVSSGGKSSEAQMVQQAIKTFSANLLEGTEQKDAWVDDAKDTMWVLVELNFDRAKEVASGKTQMDDSMKDWLDKNGKKPLADLEGREPPPSEPPPSQPPPSEPPPSNPPPSKPAQPPPSKPAQPPPEGPTATKGGPAPGWTQGKCDNDKYMCGVGDGPDRKSADIDARAELARIFQSNISSVAKSFQAAQSQVSSKTGETWSEMQSVSQFSMVSTEKVVTMSEIIERWDDGKGRQWSLAVIDRAQASAALRDQIQAKDSIVDSKLSAAQGASDNLTKWKALRAAVGALAEREALNADLRVIQKSGQGVPSPHNIGEIIGMLDSAGAELKIGIAISGSGGDRVQACLEEGLTNKNYQIEANAEEEEDEDPDVSGSFDVLIKVAVKNEKREKIAGSEVVNTMVTVKLINGKTNKVVQTLTGQEKASRPTVKAAASTSAYKICQKQIPKIIENIDRYFSK